jgi:hypothetical protein
LTSITAGSFANPVLSQGIARPRALLLIPQLAASVHGSTIAGLTSGTYIAGVGNLGSPMASPFSSSPATCCPFARVTNFNVFLSGVAVFQQPLMYGFEQYFNEVRRSNAAYGAQIRDLCSQLISQSDWETGYGFIYVDLFTRVPDLAFDNSPKAISIQLTNSTNVTVDYYAFVIFEREITLSIASGQLII